MIDLEKLGWCQHFETEYFKSYEPDTVQGRVSAQYKKYYTVMSENGEFLSEISGNMLYNKEYPAVGDWVLFQENEGTSVIKSILKRKSKISRKTAGSKTAEQIIAANIDYVMIVMSFNQDFNLNRLERYLTLVKSSNTKPVILLNKLDICPNYADYTSELKESFPDIDICAISAEKNIGLDALEKYLRCGKTSVFVGSSGVGKSTLTNALKKTATQKTGEIRFSDDKGKHITSHRELFLLENGGIIIDTPGLREIQIWDAAEGISDSFEDIEELALQCKFHNCRHENEPNCAVRKAVEQNIISERRFQNYLKLKKEQEYIDQKKVMNHKQIEKEKWRDIAKLKKDIFKDIEL